ncbi:hypothetical protein ACEUZ9_005469 [Paracoccus litorisediminis]|uniref:hypothetical protein n=1 Tax=Paracoccus litorisediminis TaxID=2006130 RepID=UPI00373102FD
MNGPAATCVISGLLLGGLLWLLCLGTLWLRAVSRRTLLLVPGDRESAMQLEIAALREALAPFAFLDAETAQAAWEIRYRDRFQDWIDFEDILRARHVLGADLTDERETQNAQA